jgi:hypothetical protein
VALVFELRASYLLGKCSFCLNHWWGERIKEKSGWGNFKDDVFDIW